MSFKKSQKLYEKGLVNLVGSVNSPVRAFTSVGGNPLFIKRGRGSQIIDVDGNKYVDLVLSYGPMVLGHRHKKVQKAVHKALKNGYSFGASTENEITLAKIVCDAFPGMDKVRFVNSGTEAVINLLESRINVLEKSLMNTLSTALYSDGTGTSGKEVGGLQLLVSDAGTGVIGGINSTTFPFWKSQQITASSSAFSTANVQTDMNNMYLKLVRGADSPDLIMADATAYKAFLGSLQAIQRITSDGMANSGFTSVAYLNSDVIFDDACPENKMYFLNTDYIRLETAASRNFVPGEAKMSINQDALVTPMFWSGNLTCSNRALQGVIHV